MFKISIIVPIYNVEKYLRKCLESVVNQTLKDIEIICINDGSTDNSLAILKEYAQKDARIKIINQENSGVSASRNKGIELATGEYLMFLDSDDWLDLKALEILYKEISINKCDIVKFGIAEVYNNNNIKMHDTNNLLSKKYEELPLESQIYLHLFCWDKIYKTNFIKNNSVNFPLNIKTSEDCVFSILTLLSNAKIKNITDVLYYYNKTNITSATAYPSDAISTDLAGLKYLHTNTLFQNADSKIKYAIINKWIGTAIWYKSNYPKINYNNQIKNYIKYLNSTYTKLELKKISNYKHLKGKNKLGTIFSVKNTDFHKVLTLCGIKFKIKYFKINTGKLKYFKDIDDNCVDSTNVNIVFGVDDNYIQQLSVTIISILLNSCKKCNFNFYILNTGLKSKNKDKLESLKNIREFNINYIDVSGCDFSKFPLNREWISIATYYRLFLSEVLPLNIEKCIYLDCDMIVEDDILELWNSDINDYLAGVVEDECSKSNVERLKLPVENNYFNAGMLVLNLKRIREFNLAENAINYFNKNKNLITLQDQDILNGIFNGKCKYVDLRWNINTPAYMREKANHYYNRDIEAYAIKNPGIIHFTGSYKPWFTYSMHPLRNEYLRYLCYSNFKNDIISYKCRELKSKFICQKKHWNKREILILGIPINIDALFSIKNEYIHKVITILGIKFKVKSKKLVERANFETIESKLSNLSNQLSNFSNQISAIIREEVSYICTREIYSAIEVAKQHSIVFPKYKNCHENKSIAIIGCGPTIQYFNNEIKNDFTIALNDAIFLDKFNFDYLFNWDTNTLNNNKKWYDDVKEYPCTKFYGHCIVENYGSPLDSYNDQELKIEHFYYSARHGWPAFSYGEIIHKDLSTHPLMDFGSIAFGALHFALYTRSKKIYFIGLDTSNIGHILGPNYECTYQLERMLRGYKKFKSFIDIYYPNCEIISVNPVGLKGLFKDVYTQSYVDAHPELLNENIEILSGDEISVKQ